MARDYLAFGDVEGKRDWLDVECTKCPRKGRYSVAKLIEQYGRYQLEGCSEAGPNTIVLIVRASRGAIRRGVAVSVDSETGKTTSMMMADLNEE